MFSKLKKELFAGMILEVVFILMFLSVMPRDLHA